MFTGLVEDVGRVEAVESGPEGARLRIATLLGAEISPGDSVAVSGACWTATAADAKGFDTEAMNQTLEVTSLGGLAVGGSVNLELAMQASGRFGGHILQGHVDGTGEVTSTVKDGFARRLGVALGPELMRYVVEKGSIALDGVSLTVAALGDGWVEASLIPETLEHTTLGEASEGDRLNVECDIVAKYVEKLVTPFAGKE